MCTTERFSTYGTTGFSPVWHLPCVLRQFDQENALVHKEQVNGFSSVWVLRCLFRLPTSENDFLHTVQLKHFSSLSVLELLACLFRPPARENVFVHKKHVKGFSSVCVLRWFPRIVGVENDFLQMEQLSGFSLLYATSDVLPERMF